MVPLLEEKEATTCKKIFFTLRKGEASFCNDVNESQTYPK